MDTTVDLIDVAQHWPFVERHLVRTPPAVRRALWFVARGQLDTDGEPCSIRPRALAAGVTAGEAGRMSVVLNELEERGALIRYRGAGRRPHLWSLRPRIDRWEGFRWGSSPTVVLGTIEACFCRAVDARVARFPGQSVADVRRKARFQLLPRDHMDPPGLSVVEMRGVFPARATVSETPGLSRRDRAATPVDNSRRADPVLSYLERSEISQLGIEERERFDRLRSVLEHHAGGKPVIPGSVIERRLLALARQLDDAGEAAARRHFDRTAGDVQVPSGCGLLERAARKYLPKVSAAL